MSSKNQVQAQLDNMLHFFTKQGFTYPSIRYELNNIKIQSEDEAKDVRSKMKDIEFRYLIQPCPYCGEYYADSSIGSHMKIHRF